MQVVPVVEPSDLAVIKVSDPDAPGPLPPLFTPVFTDEELDAIGDADSIPDEDAYYKEIEDRLHPISHEDIQSSLKDLRRNHRNLYH